MKEHGARRAWRLKVHEVIFEADTPAGKWFDDRIDAGNHLRRVYLFGRKPDKRFYQHTQKNLLGNCDIDHSRLRGYIAPEHLRPVDFLGNNDYWIWYYCCSDRHCIS